MARKTRRPDGEEREPLFEEPVDLEPESKIVDTHEEVPTRERPRPAHDIMRIVPGRK